MFTTTLYAHLMTTCRNWHVENSENHEWWMLLEQQIDISAEVHI